MSLNLFRSAFAVSGACLIIVLSLATSASGWNRRGHMMVAAVAFSDLEKSDNATKERILEILKSHPAYNSWKAEYDNGGTNISQSYTLDAYVFMRAAVWPDDIRGNKNEHKPTWHFVNYPVRLPDVVDFTTLKPKVNIFDGYNTAEDKIKAGATSKTDRAKMLSWIFHLVGDIHQPLHSVALFSDDLPTGDSGGNAQCIRPGESKATKSLHSYWDGLMGSHSVAIWDGREAWQSNVFYSSFYKDIKPVDFTGVPDMKSWAKESANLALPNAYNFNGAPLALQLAANTNKGWVCKKTDSEIAPEDYGKAAQKLASRRLVMAGYRLSNTLKKLVPAL